ncbi:MAG: 50S ribosomal protein L6 [Candidatus Nanohaloarchaeota archaeon QJJ-9]|nr:50S ribosomal protein L6 [Candidatus Nanohaloarchaeota archaeon QJJ-9]
MEEKVEIPENIEVEKEEDMIRASAGDEEVEKEFGYPEVDVRVDGGQVIIHTESSKRDDRAVIGTYKSHVENMFEGLEEEYEYKLKALYAHFPMSVKVEGNQVVIQNFIGERAPRKVDILEGVNVQVSEDEITVSGPNKEKVSQTAANIEQACYKGSRDLRKFQDGVYITSKGDK